MILFIGCRKDQENDNSSMHRSFIKIRLNENYLDAGKIDSVVGNWSISTATQRVSFQIKSGYLQASTDNLMEGSGTLKLQLYTRNKVDTLDLQWERSINWNFQRGKAIEITGPASLKDRTWQPRVIFKDARLKLYAVIALWPDDPYFELRSADPKWKYLTVDRRYYDVLGGTKIGGGVWLCPEGCYDSERKIINDDYFKFLPGQIGNSSWKIAEIHVRFSENWAMNRNFHLMYALQ